MKNASFTQWLCLAIAATLLMGCSITVGAAPTATSVPTNIPTAVPLPTATPIPTEPPVPTDTPPPSPTPGPLVIDDDFSADNGRFQCESCVVESGALTVGPFPMEDTWRPFTATCGDCGTSANYKMSVETWYAAGNSNRGFGVFVRQNEKFIYLVAMSSWQLYNVFEFDRTAGGGAGYRSLIGNWSKGGLGAGRAVHYLDIVMKDGNMTLTINKDFTRSFEIEVSKGEVGLWVGSWETSASFDNFHFEETK